MSRIWVVRHRGILLAVTAGLITACKSSGVNSSSPSPVAFTSDKAVETASAEDALAMSFKAFAEAASWSSSIEWTLMSKRTDIPMKFEGRLYGKGALLRGEMKMNLLGTEIGKHVVVDKQGFVWSELMTDEKTAVATADRRAMPDEVRLREPLGSVFRLGPLSGSTARLNKMTSAYTIKNNGLAKVGEAEVYVLVARLKDEDEDEDEDETSRPAGTSEIEQITISIGTSDALPRRIVSKAAGGDSYTIDFRDLTLDVSVEDGEFAYAPPSDVVVVDLARGERSGRPRLDLFSVGEKPDSLFTRFGRTGKGALYGRLPLLSRRELRRFRRRYPLDGPHRSRRLELRYKPGRDVCFHPRRLGD